MKGTVRYLGNTDSTKIRTEVFVYETRIHESILEHKEVAGLGHLENP